MSKIYDGKLTAWLQKELDKVLVEVLPPVGKFYEGVNSYELKVKHPKYNETRDKLISIARQYSERENETPPVEVNGEVHHGCEDEA